MIRWVIVILGFMVTAGVKSSRAQEPSGQDLVKLLACQGCHSMAGRGNNLGPNLDKVGQRLIPENIKKLLASPHGAMPNFAHLRPEELDAVATYLSGSNRIMVGEWTVINEQ